MTVYDFRELLVDDSQLVNIYDLNEDSVVYKGEICDIPEELEDIEISSIDSLYPMNDFDGYITINVELG